VRKRNTGGNEENIGLAAIVSEKNALKENTYFKNFRDIHKIMKADEMRDET